MSRSSVLTLVVLLATAALPLAAQSLTSAPRSSSASLADRVEATRRLQLAAQAVLLNPPRDAILQSNLASHPMFQQVFALMDMNKFNQQASVLMAQTFTSQELQALVAFSASPAGKSIRDKMPAFQKMLGAIAQNEMVAAMQQYTAAQMNTGANTGVTPGLTTGAMPGMGLPGGLSGVPGMAGFGGLGGLSGVGTPTGR